MQFANVPFVDDIIEYCKLAYKTANEQREYFKGPLGNDVFQCSPMPWVTFTHISHTNSGKKDNATPLFDWGKYHEKNGRIMIPISVQAHHSFVDGIHVGQFVNGLHIRVTSENIDKEHICCAISNDKDIQVTSKKAWLRGRSCFFEKHRTGKVLY